MPSLETDQIVGELARRAGKQSLPQRRQSIAAWTETVTLMKRCARVLREEFPSSISWSVGFEFEVPRRERRIDVTILAGHAIIVIEVKCGATRFSRADAWQAEQYALDLRDFHEGSRDRDIIPILVATSASAGRTSDWNDDGWVRPVQFARARELPEILTSRFRRLAAPDNDHIDPIKWEEGAYRATPSIVEAARLIYDGHDVREISASDSENLDSAVDAVIELVDACRRDGKRGIAFITGSPGSGKTLAGLNVVHDKRLGADAVFLSGNRPLVEVIREALARSGDKALRAAERRRRVKTFIQHANVFRNLYAERGDQAPSEHIVLFDEAQRAWDAAHVERKTQRESTRSEPRMLLDVMNRVRDWSVVIALVGSGQEINKGEAGLGEWGRALEQFHSDWWVRASPLVLPGAPDRPGGRLFDSQPAEVELAGDNRLHLSMNVRSPRAERLNEWVDALLDLDPSRAKRHVPTRDFPLCVTRDLDAARKWLLDRARTDGRCGLVANAGARRLRAWGLDTNAMKESRGWADWFLGQRNDVRSSYQLEVPATNFDCQGLELDWVGVCWGNDLVPDPTGTRWIVRQFVGKRWQSANDEKSRYVMNSYRVLLTRARRGQVIWVPDPEALWRNGDERYRDDTLEQEMFKGVYELLLAAGAQPLDLTVW